jgi:hypothetical protein
LPLVAGLLKRVLLRVLLRVLPHWLLVGLCRMRRLQRRLLFWFQPVMCR